MIEVLLSVPRTSVTALPSAPLSLPRILRNCKGKAVRVPVLLSFLILIVLLHFPFLYQSGEVPVSFSPDGFLRPFAWQHYYLRLDLASEHTVLPIVFFDCLIIMC